jgi:hypothetical protein
MRKLIFYPLLMMTVSVLLGGCASVQRTAPAAPGRVNIKLKNSDYTMLASVKGTSTVKSYPLSIVKVIDGTKVCVLGIKFFEDQYSGLKPNELGTGDIVLCAVYPPIALYYLYTYYKPSVSAEDRAYYKVLAASPDADAIIGKNMVKQRSGIPYILSEEEVTMTGKAIKYKPE